MKYRRHRRTEIAVPTASMGDIAFLLTIFFLVCSNFVKEAGIKVTPPKSAALEKVREPRISVIIDEKDQIYLQGQEVSDAASLESSLGALLQGRTTEEGRKVMFKCDRETDTRVFEPVLDAIAKCGGIIVAVGDQAPEVVRGAGPVGKPPELPKENVP